MSLRIAICSGQTPFIHGGAEILGDSLAAQLRKRGHVVEMIRIPFRWYPKEEILKGYLAWRLVNLEESEGQPIDRVIALKFPAFAVSHPSKITWLVQQFRQVYDLHGTEYSHFDPSSEADTELREAIWRIDTQTLSESRHIFTISNNVGKRLRQYNQLESETLYPPPALDGQFYNSGYGDYVFTISRLNRLKRLHLLVEAMKHTKTPVRCLIAGRGPELEPLQKLARRAGVDERVDFLGFISDEQALNFYASTLAVYYAPLDEDYGLVTVEGMKCEKPVLTMSDSGGVLEFVQDRATGTVVQSGDIVALARSIDELFEDRQLAERLGKSAKELVDGITWDRTVSRLLDT